MLGNGDYMPELQVSEWLKGGSVKLEDLRGSPVLVHLFQPNCPACFYHSIPNCEELRIMYGPKLKVVGLVVRFEEFDVNTKETAKKFLEDGTLTDKVYSSLKFVDDKRAENGFRATGLLNGDKYGVRIDHPIGWDAGDRTSKTLMSLFPDGRYSTPSEFMVGRDGSIVYSGNFISGEDDIRKYLDEVL